MPGAELANARRVGRSPTCPSAVCYKALGANSKSLTENRAGDSFGRRTGGAQFREMDERGLALTGSTAEVEDRRHAEAGRSQRPKGATILRLGIRRAEAAAIAAYNRRPLRRADRRLQSRFTRNLQSLQRRRGVARPSQL
jgi:hypothetical protein